jgi:hypothetical protein
MGQPMASPFRWPSPAWQLVVRASAPTPHIVDAHGVDWSHVTAIAVHQRVYPRAFAQLSRLLPPEQRSGLHAQLTRNARAALANTARTAAVVRLLEEAGVASIVLKGPLLARQLYGDLAARVAGDVDVLVPESTLLTAARALADAGYRHPTPITPESLRRLRKAEHDVAFVHPADEILVELHADIAQPHYGYRPDLAAWWAARRPADIGGATVSVLSPEHAYLLSALHAAKHRWNRLDLVMDLAAYAESDLDRAAVRREAARAWLLGPVETGEAVVASVYHDAPLESSLVRQAMSQMVDTKEFGRWRGLRFDVQLRHQWVDKLRYVWRRLVSAKLP